MSLRPRSMLLGPASLDRYVQPGRPSGEALVLPGGGALNMAYHWAVAGVPVHFLTRIGDDDPERFLDFFRRHHIGHSSATVVGHGPSASIDIELGEDRQPLMDHFVEGVWTDFHLASDEERLLAVAERLHVVLVDPVVREVERLGIAHRLDRLTVSGDFLSLRHCTVERFADTMAYLDLGFIGWPGEPDDPTLGDVRDVAFELRKLVVITFGAQGVIVFDGRSGPVERMISVDAVDVVGTTVGCGDAFIAAFLAAWWELDDVNRAVESGKVAGAGATSWWRPLPDEAYHELVGRPGLAAQPPAG